MVKLLRTDDHEEILVGHEVTLEFLQEQVGGYIELVPLRSKRGMIVHGYDGFKRIQVVCHEDELFKGHGEHAGCKINQIATEICGTPIYGLVLVLTDEDCLD